MRINDIRTDEVTIELTQGAIDNGYIKLTPHLDFFPADAIGGGHRSAAGRELELDFGGGLTVKTDIAGDKGIFRERGAVRHFLQRERAVAGLIVRIRRDGDRRFTITLGGSARPLPGTYPPLQPAKPAAPATLTRSTESLLREATERRSPVGPAAASTTATESTLRQPTLARFADVIRSLSAAELDGASTLMDKLRIARSGEIEVCYAPFEAINPRARIVVVGITPGRSQMLNALRAARHQLDQGADPQTAARVAKQSGAFSGAMRPILVDLLDSVGLQRWLGLPSCGELFGSAAHLVQTASALRNPVFVHGENYSGSPNMLRHPLLRELLLTHFGEDVRLMSEAVFVPLGDRVLEALQFLAKQGHIDRARILEGLQHPSGANAERIAYFLGRKPRHELSTKTDPDKLDRARVALSSQVASLAASS